uniref:Uncharacterized protein n=1 Tax=Anguilla anguilla TaxID=7936 RepID=A0A0E9V7S8_ANGAN
MHIFRMFHRPVDKAATTQDIYVNINTSHVPLLRYQLQLGLYKLMLSRLHTIGNNLMFF